MKKHQCARAALFIVALFLIAVWPPRAASAAVQKGLNPSPPPYWVFAGIDARVDNFSITVRIKDANGHPVTNALVMVNEHVVKFQQANPQYYFASGGQVPVSMGSQVSLRIWLNDPQTPFLKGQVPGRAPDISGSGTISNWLTPVSPVQDETITLAFDLIPRFTWAFAGAVETTCVNLRGPLTMPNSSTIIDNTCVSQPSITVPNGRLVPGSYALLYTVAFPFPLRSKLSLTPDSHVRFEYKTYVHFKVKMSITH